MREELPDRRPATTAIVHWNGHAFQGKSLPAPEVLRQLLRYEPDTGKLYWRPRSVDRFPDARACNSWNAKHSGKEAFFTAHSAGYLQGLIAGRHYFAHRVIWAMHTGAWPSEYIDHIDGNPLNNRLENLREANRLENSRNVRSAKGSSSRFLGVSWQRQIGRWIAAITINGRKHHIGSYVDEEEAAKAYDAAARKHFGDFARPNFKEEAA